MQLDGVGVAGLVDVGSSHTLIRVKLVGVRDWKYFRKVLKEWSNHPPEATTVTSEVQEPSRPKELLELRETEDPREGTSCQARNLLPIPKNKETPLPLDVELLARDVEFRQE